MPVLLSKICQRLGVELPTTDMYVAAINEPQLAGSEDITFIERAKYLKFLSTSNAAVVLVRNEHVEQVPSSMVAIEVESPYYAYGLISNLFSQERLGASGIHPSATIAEDSTIDPSAIIGANVVIDSGSVIGPDVRIGANTVIGHDCVIGENCRIDSNVTLYHHVRIGKECRVRSGCVIGSDGFGYVPVSGKWMPISQNGTVVLGDRVELGANVCIDRGAISDTVIGNDVIIDNQVHIAHNVSVGSGTAIAGQTGIAGSTNIGANCIFGGQVGVTGHVDIAAGSQFAGKSMVTKGTRTAGAYASGLPMSEQKQWRKTVARINRLEELEARLKELEDKLLRDEPNGKS